MELKDIQKMTVKKLREEAYKHKTISGIVGMKKNELVDALIKEFGIEVSTDGKLCYFIKEFVNLLDGLLGILGG